MASYRDSDGNLKGTNFPYDAINKEKRDTIGDAIATLIAQKNWRAANQELMRAAYWSGVGHDEGQGHGNEYVGGVQVADYMVDGSPHPWAAYAIKSQTSVYNTKFGVYTWDNKLGVLKDGKSIGSWGGAAMGENAPKFIDDDKDVEGAQTGTDPVDPGIKGKPPVNPVVTGGGDEVLTMLWPEVDWPGGGGDSGEIDQYEWYDDLDPRVGDYGPTVTKGLFGFSGKDPATLAKPAFGYLDAYNIGTNLAYKPGHPAAWKSGETALERAEAKSRGEKPSYYGGIPGGTKARDLLYHYGGSQTSVVRDADGVPILDKEGNVQRKTLLQPMQVPGGWKTAKLPAGAQSYYPIAQTPLYPSGVISPQGAVAPYVKPVVDKDNGKTNGKTNGNGGAGAGKKLAFYKGRAGALGGIDTSGKNIMFQVTGDPTKISVNPSGRAAYETWGDMPIDLWQGGTLFQTKAYRPLTGSDWTDANNQWALRRTSEMQAADISQFNIKFADWAGGVSSNKIYSGTPTLDFLGTPQNVKMRDPDNPAGPMLNVAYTLPTNVTTPGSSYLDPTALGTTTAQPWGQLAGMRTPGFDRATALGGKWIMPGIYGQERDTGMTTENLLGYGLPQWASDEFFASDWQSKGDLADALLEFHTDKGD